jgi:hypothetical protein
MSAMGGVALREIGTDEPMGIVEETDWFSMFASTTER